MKKILVLLFIISAKAFSQDCPAPDNAIRDAKSCVDEVENKYCDFLKPGESMIVTRSPGPVSRAYRLTKTKDDQYVVEINPAFDVTEDMLPSINAAGGFDKFFGNIRSGMGECLNQASKYMIGPNGEKLSIKISNNTLIPASRINISDQTKREHSKGYSTNIDCQTTVHETLHLLGLVDEYRETASGFVVDWGTGKAKNVKTDAEIPEYDCRALGPDDSIMSNQAKAFMDVFPQKKLTYTNCECESVDSFCADYIANNQKELTKLKDCPSGFRRSKINTQVFAPIKPGANESLMPVSDVNFDQPIRFGDAAFKARKMSAMAGGMEFGSVWAGGMVPTSFILDSTVKEENLPPKKKSLLMPAHFRMITNPYCYKANRLYTDCSQNAYESSSYVDEDNQNYTTGKCDPMPPECKNPNKWLQ